MSPTRSLTLLELLLAIALVSLVVLGVGQLDIFGRATVLSGERKVSLQNEVALILDEMKKNIGKATGNSTQFPISITAYDDPGGGGFQGGMADGATVRIREDSDLDGKLTAADLQSRYDYRNNNVAGVFLYTLTYTPAPVGAALFPVSTRITRFIVCYCGPASPGGFYNPRAMPCTIPNSPVCGASDTRNYIDVLVTACWNPEANLDAGDPASGTTCGRPENPTVTMVERIYMPQVSAN